MEAFVRDLERLAYSMLIRRMGTNDRIERFSRLTRAIEDGADLSNPESPLELTVNEREATRQVLDGPIYEPYPRERARPFCFDWTPLVSGPDATFDHPIITEEHVLPQNPAERSEWLKWFLDEDQRTALVHRVGNLALLTRKKNSAASNSGFTRKKNAYFTTGGVSPFPLTTQVLQHQTWTAEVIATRQVMLVMRLVEHWRL
jgi:Protein of unknown function (DUF1524)